MSNCRRCRQWVVAFLLVLAMASLAQAQTKAKPPPGYAEAVAQALSELEAANYPEALEEFRRAHAIFPNARTFRGQGMVEFELRHYAESVRFLEEALASKVKPLDGRQRSETEVLLSRARRYLGELVITTEPEFAIVAIDGAAIDLKLEPRLQLEVGEHAVEVRAPGFTSQRRTVNVKGGERAPLHVVLERVEAPQPAEVEPQEASSSAAPRLSEDARTPPNAVNRPLLWSGVVLLGAGVASEVAAWVLFSARLDKGDDVLRSVDTSRDQAWKDARTPMLATAIAGTISASAGVALLTSAFPPKQVPWWLAGVSGAAGAALLAWGAVDLAQGESCGSRPARTCLQDEQRQDRGILLLGAAAPLLTLLVTRAARSRLGAETQLSVAVTATGARLSGAW